jgi:invasion protein IalB
MKKSAALGLTLALLATAAVAATAPGLWSHTRGPQPAAQPIMTAQNDAPQRTTATYGDWVVQCVTTDKPPAKESCDMAQVTQLKGKNVPFSRVAVFHPGKSQPVKLTVQVPVNASFAAEVRIKTADTDPGVAAPFARCTPNGCFAEFDLKDDVLRKFRAATSVGKLSFADAGGHAVDIPISFKGFGQAFDALAKK